MNTPLQLHPHQQETRARLGEAFLSGHRSLMVQAPTAFGKTVLATSIVTGALAKPKRHPDGTSRTQRICIVVPAISLINQTYDKLKAHDIWEVGVIQADHPLTNPMMPVQIASVQTLQARHMFQTFDLVLIDEAHKWFKFYETWLPMLREEGALVIGLSASPWTKGLGKWFDDLIVGATTAELIKQGYLSDFRVFNSPRGIKPDLSKVKTVAGDYHEGQLSDVMKEDSLVADAVRTWLDKASDRPTMVFAVDRAHAAKLQQQYIAAGVPAGYIDQHTEIVEREQIRELLRTGAIKVVCNVDCLTIGVDWPFVSCIQNCRPTKSEMRYVQAIGRGLRISPETGKTDCLILDHSNTTENLGFVDDCYDRMTEKGLDSGKHQSGGKREKKPTKTTMECGMCGHLRRPMVLKCPDCGFEPKRQSQVQFGTGELSEAKRARKRKRPYEERQAWYSGLIHYAAERGYSPGWAYHKFREWNGSAPGSDLDKRPFPPTPTMLSWIRSRMIQWARSKNNPSNSQPGSVL